MTSKLNPGVLWTFKFTCCGSKVTYCDPGHCSGFANKQWLGNYCDMLNLYILVILFDSRSLVDKEIKTTESGSWAADVLMQCCCMLGCVESAPVIIPLLCVEREILHVLQLINLIVLPLRLRVRVFSHRTFRVYHVYCNFIQSTCVRLW